MMKNSMMGKVTQTKRKKYVIHSKYQYSILASILLIVILVIITAILATHYFLLAAIVRALETKGSMLSGNDLIDISMKPLIIVIPIMFVILSGAFILVIFISHRTAGPLHSLKKAMQRVGQGDLTVELAFRKNDEIHDVAHTFNDMVKGLKKNFSGKKPQT
jgi:methyl-accepting chemotaxis protein